MTDDEPSVDELRDELRCLNDELDFYKAAYEREHARGKRLWALVDMIEVADGACRLKADARTDADGWLGEVGCEIPF